MDGVTIVSHPLVQHKLTLLRRKDISTKSFRELLKEIGMLLCYEITRDLPLADVDIETPLARMRSPFSCSMTSRTGRAASRRAGSLSWAQPSA